MNLRVEIANLNRAALVAHEAWGSADPRTQAISGRIHGLRRQLAEQEGTACGGAFARTSPGLLAQRAKDEATLSRKGGATW